MSAFEEFSFFIEFLLGVVIMVNLPVLLLLGIKYPTAFLLLIICSIWIQKGEDIEIKLNKKLEELKP